MPTKLMNLCRTLWLRYHVLKNRICGTTGHLIIITLSPSIKAKYIYVLLNDRYYLHRAHSSFFITQVR